MKKILNHLNKEWYKYLLEMIVITAGILGAYALNNWNESSKSDIKKEALQRSLIAEFQSNLRQLDTVIFFHRNAALAGVEFLRLIVTKDTNLVSAKGDSIFLHFTSLWTFDPVNGALRSGISSGDIHLIENEILLSTLFEWEDLVRDSRENEDMAVRHMSAFLEKFNKDLQYINVLNPT